MASAAPPVLLVVTGASGAGKTTIVRRLAALQLPGIGCYHFDTIGIPSAEEIDSHYGGGLAFQRWALSQWMERLCQNEDRVVLAVLDAQVRPSDVREVFARHEVARGYVTLVDCSYEERHARLRGEREQPELVNFQMDAWAAYLRGQADALGLRIIDTTGATPEASLAELRKLVALVQQA